MIRTTFTLVAALAAFAPLLSAQDQKPPRKPPLKPVATRATEAEVPWFFQVGMVTDPELTLPDLDGKARSLQDYRGQTLVISFWNQDCPWSVKADPKLKALWAKYADQKTKKGERKIEFVAIDASFEKLGQEGAIEKIRTYAKKAELPFPILLDREFVAATRFRASTTPHVFVIDRTGVLIYSGAIDDDPKGEKKGEEVKHYLVDAVQKAMQPARELKTTETKPFGCRIKHKRVPRPLPAAGAGTKGKAAEKKREKKPTDGGEDPPATERSGG